MRTGRPRKDHRPKTLFGKKLKKLMEGKKTVQTSFDLNISYSTLRSWMRGDTTPSKTRMRSIAEYFSVSYEWLSGEAESPDAPRNALTAKQIVLLDVLMPIIARLKDKLVRTKAAAEMIRRSPEAAEAMDPKTLADEFENTDKYDGTRG